VSVDLAMSPSSSLLSVTRAQAAVGCRLLLLSNGLKSHDLALIAKAVRSAGIEVAGRASQRNPVNFEHARRMTVEFVRREMLSLETELLRGEPHVSTVMDGLLDQRLETFPSHNVPAVGVVKRQLRVYLHARGLAVVQNLKPGQCSPAFLLDTTRGVYVNFYLRLQPLGEEAPDSGIVRVSISQEFFEQSLSQDSDYLNTLASWLFRLRNTALTDLRSRVSLEPILRTEDHLRALLPDLDERVGAFNYLTGLRRPSLVRSE
jgi:hypothetical protein